MIRALDQATEAVSNQIHAIFQRSYREEALLVGAEQFPPLLRTKHQIRTATTSFLGSWVESELAAVVEYAFKAPHLSIDSLVVEPKHFRR